MPLNPHAAGLRAAGLDANRLASPFRALAENALNTFRQLRDELKQQVRSGELTLKVARARAALSATTLRHGLDQELQARLANTDAFQDRLFLVADKRRAAAAAPSLEQLQQETNRLLQQTLIEQQLQSRVLEFEARAHVRPLNGGQPAPTLQSLLAMHQQASQDDDAAAQEWARRQLQAFKPRVLLDEDRNQIEAACDRPDQVNPAIVSKYIQALEVASSAQLDRFLEEALSSQDASACCAAFVAARAQADGQASAWAVKVLHSLSDFPAPALESLQNREHQLREASAVAARAAVEFVAALADEEASLPGLKQPTEAELAAMARVLARPIAGPDEPIGLTLSRRGQPAGFVSPQPETAPSS